MQKHVQLRLYIDNFEKQDAFNLLLFNFRICVHSHIILAHDLVKLKDQKSWTISYKWQDI